MYHCSVKVIGRSSGRSSVGSAAYRSGEKIVNERDGKVHDYTRKKGVVHKEIMLPKDAPSEFKDRSTLWNTVEKVEKRRDAQTAREVEVALPKEFNREDQLEVLRSYVKENFTDKGMCADVCVHDKGNGNPHAHIMLTTRNVSKDGFGAKNREWNDRQLLEEWRENWAKQCNEMYKKKAIDKVIDHRSYKKQGIDKVPTIHIGSSASAMERRGKKTERGNLNREIKLTNDQLDKIRHDLEVLSTQREIAISQVNTKTDEKVEVKQPLQDKLEGQGMDPLKVAAEEENRVLRLQVCKNRLGQLLENEQELNKALDSVNEKYIGMRNQLESVKNSYSNTKDYNARIKELKEEKESLSIFKATKKKELDKKIEELRDYRDNEYRAVSKRVCRHIESAEDLKRYIEKVEIRVDSIAKEKEALEAKIRAIQPCKEDLKQQYITIGKEIEARHINVRDVMDRIKSKQNDKVVQKLNEKQVEKEKLVKRVIGNTIKPKSKERGRER